MIQNNIQWFRSKFPAKRKVYDSIYGFINFPLEIWQFIDTAHFQRLRNIKQLGTLFWLFPGAINTRFEHSLGTGYLAQKYITTLISNHKNRAINEQVYVSYHGKSHQQNDYTIKTAVFIVTLAGVLHDVGHGPYSHLFDTKVVPEIDGIKWEHQIASLHLIDAMYNQILQHKHGEQKIWLQSTRNRVKSLIIGKIKEVKYRILPNGTQVAQKQQIMDHLPKQMIDIFNDQIKIRPWQFQIISNRFTGIDVDKLDYFRRDAYYVGAKNIFIDHQLLMNETLILQQQNIEKISQKHRLCYPTKYSQKVYDVFYSRYKLYKTYYQNLKSNGIDLMIAQVLKQAGDHFGFVHACKQLKNNNCKQYIRLTDSIIDKVQEQYYMMSQQINIKISKGIQLSKAEQGIVNAQKIISNLKCRKIYDFIREYHKSYTFQQMGTFRRAKKKLSQLAKQINSAYPDFVMNVFEVGFGIKDKDPFKQCRFYDKTKQIKTIQKEQNFQNYFSMLRSDKIIQLSIGLYSKIRYSNPSSSDKKYIQNIINEVKQKIEKTVDKEFLSGYSGTYTNRGQTKQPQQSQKRNQNQNNDENLLK